MSDQDQADDSHPPVPSNISKWKIKKAVKILTQYKRLANKLNIRLSAKRIADLDRLRDAGRISTSDLPAGLLRDFPAELAGLSLDDICK